MLLLLEQNCLSMRMRSSTARERTSKRCVLKMNSRIYIGDLGPNGSKQELEREFESYGPLKSVWVARNPPGFAFVEFEDPRDADEAVRDMDGRVVCGARIRCEFAKMSSTPNYSGRRGPRRGPPPAIISSRYRRSPRRHSRLMSCVS